jgi:hypothetical protein
MAVLLILVRMPAPLHHQLRSHMRNKTVSEPGLPATSFFEMKGAASRARRTPRLQFWCCTLMGCLMLILGAWVRYGARSMGPLAAGCSAIVALPIWLCVPAFVYYAWQGFRQTAPASALQRSCHLPMRAIQLAAAWSEHPGDRDVTVASRPAPIIARRCSE